MGFVDSHVHLSDVNDRRGAIEGARETGTRLFAVSIDERTSRESLRLAIDVPLTILPFAGVHPSEAGRTKDLGWIEGLLGSVAGIGEIGLDASYTDSPARDQSRLFEAQLELAEEHGLPVQVHTRKAERTCLDRLSSRSLKSVLLHWFEGEEYAEEAVGRGMYASFGPALLYSKRLQRIASRWDPSRVLTESDGPVAYEALQKSSGPSLIPSVVFKFSELAKTSFLEAAAMVETNATRFLSGGKG